MFASLVEQAEDAWQAALAIIEGPDGPKSKAANSAISKAESLFENARLAVEALDPSKSKKPGRAYRASAGRTRNQIVPFNTDFERAKQAFERLRTLRSQVIRLNSGFIEVQPATHTPDDREGHFADITALMARIAELQAKNEELAAKLSRAQGAISPPGVVRDNTEEYRLAAELDASQQTIATLIEKLRKHKESNQGGAPMPRPEDDGTSQGELTASQAMTVAREREQAAKEKRRLQKELEARRKRDAEREQKLRESQEGERNLRAKLAAANAALKAEAARAKEAETVVEMTALSDGGTAAPPAVLSAEAQEQIALFETAYTEISGQLYDGTKDTEFASQALPAILALYKLNQPLAIEQANELLGRCPYTDYPEYNVRGILAALGSDASHQLEALIERQDTSQQPLASADDEPSAQPAAASDTSAPAPATELWRIAANLAPLDTMYPHGNINGESALLEVLKELNESQAQLFAIELARTPDAENWVQSKLAKIADSCALLEQLQGDGAMGRTVTPTDNQQQGDIRSNTDQSARAAAAAKARVIILDGHNHTNPMHISPADGDGNPPPAVVNDAVEGVAGDADIPSPPEERNKRGWGWWLTAGTAVTALAGAAGTAFWYFVLRDGGEGALSLTQTAVPPIRRDSAPVPLLADGLETNIGAVPEGSVFSFIGVNADQLMAYDPTNFTIDSIGGGIQVTVNHPFADFDALTAALPQADVDNYLPVDATGNIALTAATIGGQAVEIRNEVDREGITRSYLSINNPPAFTAAANVTTTSNSTDSAIPFQDSSVLATFDPDPGARARTALEVVLSQTSPDGTSTALPWSPLLPEMDVPKWVKINEEGAVADNIGVPAADQDTALDRIRAVYPSIDGVEDGRLIGEGVARVEGWHPVSTAATATVLPLNGVAPAGFTEAQYRAILDQYGKTADPTSKDFLVLGSSEQIQATLAAWNIAPKGVHGLWGTTTSAEVTYQAFDTNDGTSSVGTHTQEIIWQLGRNKLISSDPSATSPYGYIFLSADNPGAADPDPNADYTVSITRVASVGVRDTAEGATWSRNFRFEEAYEPDALPEGWVVTDTHYEYRGTPEEIGTALQNLGEMSMLGRTGNMEATLPAFTMFDRDGKKVFIQNDGEIQDLLFATGPVSYRVPMTALNADVIQQDALAQTDATQAMVLVDLTQFNGLDTCTITGPGLPEAGISGQCDAVDPQTVRVSLPQQAGPTSSAQMTSVTYQIASTGAESAKSVSTDLTYTVAPIALPQPAPLNADVHTVGPTTSFQPFTGLTWAQPVNIHDTYQLQVVLAEGATTASLADWTAETVDGVTTYTSPELTAAEVDTQAQNVAALQAQFAAQSQPSGSNVIDARANRVTLNNITPGADFSGAAANTQSVSVNGQSGLTFEQPAPVVTVEPPSTTPGITDNGVGVALLDGTSISAAGGFNPLDTNVFTVALGNRLVPTGTLPEYIIYDAAANALTATIGPETGISAEDGFDALKAVTYDLTQYSAAFGTVQQDVAILQRVNGADQTTLLTTPVQLTTEPSASWSQDGIPAAVALQSSTTTGDGVLVFTGPYTAADPNTFNLFDVEVPQPNTGDGIVFTAASTTGWTVDPESGNWKQTGLTLPQVEAALAALRVVSADANAGTPGSVTASTLQASVRYTGTDTVITGGTVDSASIELTASALDFEVTGCPDAATPVPNGNQSIVLCPAMELIGGNTGTRYYIEVTAQNATVANFENGVLEGSPWTLVGGKATGTFEDKAAAQASLQALHAHTPDKGPGDTLGDTAPASFQIDFQPVDAENNPIGGPLASQTFTRLVQEADIPSIFQVLGDESTRTFGADGLPPRPFSTYINFKDADGAALPDDAVIELVFDLTQPGIPESNPVFSGFCRDNAAADPNNGLCYNNGANQAFVFDGLASPYGGAGWNVVRESIAAGTGLQDNLVVRFDGTIDNVEAINTAFSQIAVLANTDGRKPSGAATFSINFHARIFQPDSSGDPLSGNILAQSSQVTLNNTIPVSRRRLRGSYGPVSPVGTVLTATTAPEAVDSPFV